jgi:hypothetical protein
MSDGVVLNAVASISDRRRWRARSERPVRRSETKRVQISRRLNLMYTAPPSASWKGFAFPSSCVPSMFDSLEVKVLFTT